MQIRRDKYTLGKSETVEITNKISDIKADIKLDSNNNEVNIGSSISGTIVDTFNNPIQNAIVKLMNNRLEPLANVRTDINGKYVINIVPSSSIYTVLAIASGKILNQSPSFSLMTGESKLINFTLSNDPNALFGAISGFLTDNNNNIISGAIISLYKITNNSSDLSAITYSDNQGNFIFSELLPSNYKIVISTLSYHPSEEIITLESGKIYSTKKILLINETLSDGSISGIITDKLNIAIADADVILYKLENNNSQTPVAFTKTNSSGIYSFANVPFGSYMIKSNATQSLDLKTPISPMVSITSTLQLGTYNLSTGFLENGAMVDYSTGLVTYIGGKNNGAVVLPISVANGGLYTLAIQYICGDFNKPLKIEINDKDTGNEYLFPITPGTSINAIKTFDILVTLNSGNNIVKFYGNGIDAAPDLQSVTVILNQTQETSIFATEPSMNSNYNVAMGELSGNAKINEVTGFITGLGGTKDGSSTVTVNEVDAGIYYLSVRYLSTANNLKLKVDVNDDKKGNVYMPPTTKSTNVSDALIFTFPVILKDNTNTIKFHGDGKSLSPDLEEFLLQIPPITSNLANGVLENDAKIDTKTNFVEGIGGPTDGSSTVTANLSTAGQYNLIFQYLSLTNNTPLKVSINAINSTTIFTLPSTETMNISDAKTFTIPVTLKSGNNSIKFHGNGKSISATLGSFVLSFNTTKTSTLPKTPTVPQDSYSLTNAGLEGPSVLDNQSGLVNWIGGKGNGICTMKVMVDTTGDYVLRINYRGTNRPLKLEIPEVKTSTIYNINGPYIGTFSTLIPLDKGINTLKFSGVDESYAPDLGDFTINLNLSSTYPLSNGLLSENAKVLPSGAIGNLGGFSDESLIISYFAMNTGSYNLILTVDGYNGRSLLLDIDGKNTGTIYNIPSSNNKPPTTYTIPIFLDDGENSFTFHGDGTNPAPDIYTVDCKLVSAIPKDHIFRIASGTLADGAQINPDSNLVEGLGGMNNGSVTLTVVINETATYDLMLNYIEPYVDSPLKIDVNGTYLGTYTLPITDFAVESDPEIFTITIPFNKGENTIKFYGNGYDEVSILESFELIKSAPVVETIPKGTYYAKDGMLSSNAKVDSVSDFFVTGLGGSKDDSVTLKVNVEESDDYNLYIQYITRDDNNQTLTIDINNTPTGLPYKVIPTNGITIKDSKFFGIPITLKAGENTIKIHGDGKTMAPDIGQVTISKIPITLTYDIADGLLENLARLNNTTKFVENLGGDNNGSSTIKVNTQVAGTHYITFDYISTSNSNIKVDVNGVNTGASYKLSPTTGTLPSTAKNFTFKADLKSGKNTIKFYGDGKNLAPSLGPAIISSTKLIKTYNVSQGLLLDGASKYGNGDFVSLIGGQSNGSSTVNVNVTLAGVYDIVFKYISPIIERPVRIEVNDINDDEIYLPPLTEDWDVANAKTFTIPHYLNAGKNTIKFEGNGSSLAPIIGEFYLSLSNDKPMVYNISNGTLSGSAMVNKNTMLVENIGGEENGTASLKLNVKTAGWYNLIVQYVSVYDESNLLVDINKVPINQKFIFPLTLNWSLANIDTFIIKANLKIGDNTIKFYGDGKNPSPMLGTITLNLITNQANPLPPNVYDIAAGELKDGALIDSETGFVYNLGTPKGYIPVTTIPNGATLPTRITIDASVTVTVTTESEGIYSIILDYISPDSNPFTIDINDENIGYIFMSRESFNLEQMEFTAHLQKGTNTIKIHGTQNDPCPAFGKLYLQLLKSKMV
ncbi:carboxypeptidase regulatory-like domain-containing protein [Clostridium tarantellae]|uniref:Uncharacterized protein n=1 Tax=Clostridium tarantellae TaxID=39493 RepID=A0A6I1MKK7_9CLOT|nr:carboxypeptidase regulatory-like domain-containing protein [Clostridium tarantellae]MPQ43935.1 hypothetical protein [Clostridium tarantellae]